MRVISEASTFQQDSFKPPQTQGNVQDASDHQLPLNMTPNRHELPRTFGRAQPMPTECRDIRVGVRQNEQMPGGRTRPLHGAAGKGEAGSRTSRGVRLFSRTGGLPWLSPEKKVRSFINVRRKMWHRILGGSPEKRSAWSMHG